MYAIRSYYGFRAYKATVVPESRFNAGKLLDGGAHDAENVCEGGGFVVAGDDDRNRRVDRVV